MCSAGKGVHVLVLVVLLLLVLLVLVQNAAVRAGEGLAVSECMRGECNEPWRAHVR